MQAFKVIADAQKMEKQKSLKLLKIYNDVLQMILQLDVTFLNHIKTSEGDVLAKIKSRMERIKERKYVVLVAGSLTFHYH